MKLEITFFQVECYVISSQETANISNILKPWIFVIVRSSQEALAVAKLLTSFWALDGILLSLGF